MTRRIRLRRSIACACFIAAGALLPSLSHAGSALLMVDVFGSPVTKDTHPFFFFNVTGGVLPVATQCQVDLGGFVACTSPYQVPFPPLGEGPHTITVQAVDSVENQASDSLEFTVDTTPPVVTVPGPPSNPDVTNDATPSIVFSLGEPGTAYCKIDGSSFLVCLSPFVIPTPIQDGSHTFQVYATDAANNAGAPAAYFFVVDTVPPHKFLSSVSAFDWSKSATTPIEAAITKLMVTFDEAMVGANDTASWQGVSAGPNKVLETNACGPLAGDDLTLAIVAGQNLPGVGELLLGTGSGVQSGRHRVLACPGLTDTAGNALAGTPVLTDFEVALDPQPVNPNFDDTLEPWSGSGPDPSAWGRGPDAEGRPLSSSAQLNVPSGQGATWRLEQCLPVSGAKTGSAAAVVRMNSESASAPTVRFSYGFTTAANCSGVPTVVDGTAAVIGEPGGYRLLFEGPVDVPQGATAFRFGFKVEGGSETSYVVEIDRVQYPALEKLFSNGFE